MKNKIKQIILTNNELNKQMNKFITRYYDNDNKE